MIPLPDDLVFCWRPMWAADAHPTRPWWSPRREGGLKFGAGEPPIVNLVWTRVDGLRGPGDRAYVDSPARLYADLDTELARIDAGHPLPAPPALPGQVWVWVKEWRATGSPGGLDAGQLYVMAGTVSTILGSSPATNPERTPLVRLGSHPTDIGRTWPMPGAVLVAGPTPWGWHVPWSFCSP